MNYKTDDGKWRVDFQGGESRCTMKDGKLEGVNYMLTVVELNEDEEVELYAEVPVSDFCDIDYETFDWDNFDYLGFDDYSYPLLKESIIEQAVDAGIDPTILEFPLD